jgi:hypothetical protein
LAVGARERAGAVSVSGAGWMRDSPGGRLCAFSMRKRLASCKHRSVMNDMGKTHLMFSSDVVLARGHCADANDVTCDGLVTCLRRARARPRVRRQKSTPPPPNVRRWVLTRFQVSHGVQKCNTYHYTNTFKLRHPFSLLPLLAPHYFAQCKMSCKILCRLLKFCAYF